LRVWQLTQVRGPAAAGAGVDAGVEAGLEAGVAAGAAAFVTAGGGSLSRIASSRSMRDR
jgi:hypothetical protein